MAPGQTSGVSSEIDGGAGAGFTVTVTGEVLLALHPLADVSVTP